MLPPNLTRHFYEARRTFLQSAGQESTPWFQLSPVERTVVESEMELFRQAIRAAEEEQDLLASLNKTAEASRPTVADTAAAADDGAAANCECPGCSAVAALLELLARTPKGLLDTVPQTKVTKGPFAVKVVLLDIESAPAADEESTRLRKVAEDAVTQWVAAGKPLDVVDDTKPGPWGFSSRWLTVGELDDLLGKSSSFDRMRWNRWKPSSPQAFVRDIGV
ncbi:hypothetical protein [Streptomyces sp. SP18BB07]|uniref:hypothetical protein n=1 Tax=Streptomyces sp. SP18BB07 TaxID=3002522 RepID=UPI002E761558|nr:hypothetical protein [Streptomyces sp. SP18BB07]MEE1764354.1 hypothetical protein [Streptomyces sp. SP18BB07]